MIKGDKPSTFNKGGDFFAEITSTKLNSLSSNIQQLRDYADNAATVLPNGWRMCSFIGKVGITGPLGSEDDSTDASYWVIKETQDPTQTDILAEIKVVDDTMDGLNVVKVTNIPEMQFHTHNLAKDTYVLVIGFLYHGVGEPKYVMSEGGSSTGTKKYQMFQMVTDNQTGWDFARAHS